jgi:hypothetical protein
VKNITVSVDNEVYHAARVTAAQQRTSVSSLVRNYLDALAQGRVPLLAPRSEAQEQRNRRKLVRLFKGCKLDLGYKPSRAKTYESGRFSRF